MGNFEKYLSDFSSTINIWDFLINLLIVTIIAWSIKVFYIRYGRSISNRRKFSATFIPLALATMLIITVIKTSIALSLGLVGALSIVRFRAAIKDPEELTYLFLIIGLGVIGGANKPILALVSFVLILPILYLNNRISQKEKAMKGKTFLNIKMHSGDVKEVTDKLSGLLPYLELKRADSNSDMTYLSYVCRVKSVDQLHKVQQLIKELDASAEISFIDQPDLIL